MTNDIVFGTDILQDDAAKLTKIYIRVKSGGFSNEEYNHTNISCQLLDISLIDFFTRQEGNRRVATTALLCASISKIYSVISDYSVSVFDIEQVFGRLMAIDEVDWVIEDTVKLKMSVSASRIVNITSTGIYIPVELWGMIYRISMDLGIWATSFILYLLRTGVVEYNEFIKRFSSGSVDIPCEYLKYAEQSEKRLLSALDIRYSDMINRIKYLYNTYDKILDDGHEDLKEVMKNIIDKSTQVAKG